MKTILVSGASGIVGYGILRSLRRSGLDVRLLGTSVYTDSVAPAFCDTFVQAPGTNEPGYMRWLLDTIAGEHVDMIVPGIEIDMYKWVEHLTALSDVGCTPLLNTPSLISLCKDKWEFFLRLRSAGIACAIDSSLERDYDVLAARYGESFLLKPRQGFGSKGIVRVNSAATFLDHRAAMGSTLMAQPIVGDDDEEYTTSAYCDGVGGFSACMTLRRRLSRDGFTEKATVASSDEFLESIQTLCGLLLPSGPTNFQFRATGEGAKLLEINPRISSSTSIRSAFGYNESAMAVTHFFQGTLPAQPAIRAGRAVRYTDEQIFHEDSVHI